ncbi:uncharacterized protein ARMOST_11690 [Armillaria ostoyae]|uniref:Uncharacterized protein n=1 Tax=Armillaria ostoyae TaxID=47428 RepID=A0A284RHX9_ARMOS|nr:uncharacterized protein ARMOST_11690 [Armillaria ostoyae]
MAKSKHVQSLSGLYIHSSGIASIIKPSNTGRNTKAHKSFHASVPNDIFSYLEDLNMLTCTADAEDFSYLLGDKLVDVAKQSHTTDGEKDGMCVTAPLKNVNTENLMLTWRPYCDKYLDEML